MTEPLDVEERRESPTGRRESDDFREAVKKEATELKWLGAIITAGAAIWAAGIATAIAWAEWHDLPDKLVAQDEAHLNEIDKNAQQIGSLIDSVEKLIANDAQGARNDAYLFCVTAGEPPRLCADRLVEEGP